MSTAIDPGKVNLFKKISNMPSNKAPELGIPNPLQSNIKQIDGFDDGIFFAKVKPQPSNNVELFAKKDYKKDGISGLKGTDLPKKFSLATGLMYEADGEIASNRISQIAAVNRALRMYNNPTMAEYLLGRKLTAEEIMNKTISIPKSAPPPMEPIRRSLLPNASLLPLDLLTSSTVIEEKKSKVPVEASEPVMNKAIDKKLDDIKEEEDSREHGALNINEYLSKINKASSTEELSSLAEMIEAVVGKQLTEQAEQIISNKIEDIINYESLPKLKQNFTQKLLNGVGWDIDSAKNLIKIDMKLKERLDFIESQKGKEEIAPPTEEPPKQSPPKRGRPRLPPPYVVPPESAPEQISVGDVYGYLNFAKSGEKSVQQEYRGQLYQKFIDIAGVEGKDPRIRKVFMNPNTNPETLIAWFYAYGGLEDFVPEDDFGQDIIEIFNKKVIPVKKQIKKSKDGSSSSSGAGIKKFLMSNKEMPEKDVEFVKDRLKVLMGSLEGNNRPNKRLVNEAGQMVQYLLLHKAIPKKLAVSIMNKVVNLNSK